MKMGYNILDDLHRPDLKPGAFSYLFTSGLLLATTYVLCQSTNNLS
jgi:hypothetical protein